MFDRLSSGVALLLALAGITLAAAEIFIFRGGLRYEAAMLALVVAMLSVGGWWLGRQPVGTPFREMAWPAAVATVMPLLVGGELLFDAAPGSVSIGPWLLGAGAAGTLGLVLADTLPAAHRTPVTLITAALAMATPVVGLLSPSRPSFESAYLLSSAAVVLLAATTAVPGIVAGVVRRGQPQDSSARASVVAALELGVIGITPAISVMTVWGQGGSPLTALPLVIWILAVLAAQYLAVRPLSRTATIATTQRDMVVEAMEAERARIAADIHDDALQELTLLGWRLDAAGDREGAATAREVAERLRAILGDLRLPILDDLGAGAALEWLVERVGRLAGGEVRLERSDSVRPPDDVELAFFRIAQEALSNALRHGQPPVVVRYWTSPSGASLSIDDAGPGIAPGAASAAEAAQSKRASDPNEPMARHFGLLNMRQRAEQIGALLDVRRWPSGGTRVTLEWRAQ